MLQPLMRAFIGPEKTGQGVAYLKLDFAKAYDSVRWEFLSAMMLALGCGPRFTETVMKLHRSARATVVCQGEPSAFFSLGRGVRQGCPLAPFLFTIVAEALSQLLLAAVEEGVVDGLRMQDGSQQIINQFADDTFLFLVAEERNLRNVKGLLDTFSLASGILLNWGKCSALWAQLTPPPPCLTLFPWKVLPGNVCTKLLGIPFGGDVSMGRVWDEILQGL
jgi:hypothetical protein